MTAVDAPRPSKSRRIIISGAGIAGLTAALCLVRRGWLVTILERRQTASEIGAGLQLSANACSVFEQLGLLADLQELASAPDTVQMRRGSSNRILCELPTQHRSQTRFSRPYLVMHRADLHGFLMGQVAVNEDIDLQQGCEVADVANHDNGVTVLCSRGTDYLEYDGRALIVAEGVFSRTRAQYFDDIQATYTGKVAWRALIEREHPLPPTTMAWLGNRAHLVAYPLRGGTQLNLVAFTNSKSEPDQSWSIPGEALALKQEFKSWAPAITSILDTASSWTSWPVFEVRAKSAWVNKHVALIGDAAHAMQPFLAQGAAMAIEDAAVLGHHLSPLSEVHVDLQAWQISRRKRVKKVARAAREAGDIYHFGIGMAQARDLGLWLMPASRLLARYDWINKWQAPPIPQDYNQIYLS